METLVITYTGSSSYSADSIILEQKEEEYTNTVNNEVLQAMYNLAIQGVSAENYISLECPVVLTTEYIEVLMTVYVKPSREDISYNLTGTNSAVISNKSIIHQELDDEYIVNNTDTLSLDSNIKTIDLEWVTPCFDTQCNIIQEPTYSVTNNTIVFSTTVFGVVRIKSTTTIYSHDVVVKKYYEGEEGTIHVTSEGELGDPDLPEPTVIGISANSSKGYLDIDLTSTITCNYIGSEGDESTVTEELEPPDCVSNALDVCLEDTSTLELYSVNFKGNDPVLIRYDGCSGDTLQIKFLDPV